MPLNLPEQPDWVPMPPEESPTIGATDTRYHVIFSDAPDQENEVERLGLMLTESGPVGFNVQMTSPFSGQLGGPGNREDKDLSRYSVRSQRDWRGGRGQLTTYGDTDRFHDSLADTRFPNQVLLPPAKTKAALTITTDPEFTPQAGSGTSQMAVSASWAGRTRSNQTAHATWTQASTGEGYDAALIGVRTARYYQDAFSLLRGFQFQKFTASSNVTATTVQLRVARIASGQPITGSKIVIYSNQSVAGVDSPNASIWNHTITTPEGIAATETPTWTTFTGDSPVSIVSGTKYWIGVVADSGFGVKVGIAANGISGGEVVSGDNLVVSNRVATDAIVFKINSGPVLGDGTLTRVRLAQKFTAAASNNTTTVQLLLTKQTWGAGSTLSVNIYSDSAGSPNAIVGATGTVTMPANTSEQQVTVSMVCALTSGSTYWIVVTPGASTFANNISVVLGGATLSPTEAQTSTDTGSGGSWTAVTTTALFFYVNYSGGTHDSFYQYVKTITSRAQSFVTPATGTVTPTKVRLRLQRITWAGSPTLTLGLYSDSAGLPGTLLKTATITSADFTAAGAVTTPNWVEFTPGSPAGLTAATTYWLALVPTAPTLSDFLEIQWQTDTLANYAGGTSSYQTQVDGSGSWAAGTTGTDGYFIINNGTGIASSVTIRPVQFSGAWYIAAGLNVYKYNTTSDTLDLKYTASATITALCSFGGYIYAALGDGTSDPIARSSDGASWGTVAGKYYTHLLSYNGYMYAAKSVGGTTGLAYYNGTVWSPDIVLANSSVTVSDLIGFGNELLITATTGLWALSSNLVYQVLDFSNEQYAGNGINSLTWMADGRLYIPVGQSLHAYDGTRLVPVGLDLEEGLPLDQQGHVSCLVGSRTFLFAAVDGGTISRSGVYAFNGKGWHCLAQASSIGRRIRSLGLEQITSATSRPRLWYFEDGSPYYLEFPDLTDNPNGYLDSAGTGIAYQPTGYVTSAWIGGELSAVPKDFQSIIVASTGCTTTKTIDLFIEVDRSGVWLPAGTVTRSPLQEYALLSRTWGPLTVATTTKAGSSTTTTIVVSEDTAIDLQVGDFVRINGEIRQVATLESSDSFGVSVALPEAPAVGDYVYPSRPSGREIRYKAILNSNVATVTPVLQRVSVRMQERLIDKFRFTLTVRVESAMRLHGSVAAADAYTAAELRAALYVWIKRLSPFYFTDPSGVVYRVKVANASESGWTRTNDEGVSSWRSQITIILDEV